MMTLEEEADSLFLTDLSLTDSDCLDTARADCADCLRPVTVCWCPHLPSPRIEVATKVIVLQHPGELKRNIRTCRMLELGLAPQCVTVSVGRKFPGTEQALSVALSQPGTRLLYPGPEAQPLDSLQAGEVTTLVLLDGTWEQARKLYSRNPAVQRLGKVSLSVAGPSLYVVRTQPNSACLSTLEAAVHSLALLEDRPEIVEPLLAPLLAMCNVQINHGAVSHHDRELKQQAARFRQENRDFKKRKPQFRK